MVQVEVKTRHAIDLCTPPSRVHTHRSRVDPSPRDSRRDSETSDPLSVMRIAWQSLLNQTKKQRQDGDTNNSTTENGMSDTRTERKGDKPRALTSDQPASHHTSKNSERFPQREEADTTSSSCPAHHSSPTVNFRPERNETYGRPHRNPRLYDTRAHYTFAPPFYHQRTTSSACTLCSRFPRTLWGARRAIPPTTTPQKGPPWSRHPPLKRADPWGRRTAKKIQTYAGGDKSGQTRQKNARSDAHHVRNYATQLTRRSPHTAPSLGWRPRKRSNRTCRSLSLPSPCKTGWRNSAKNERKRYNM